MSRTVARRLGGVVAAGLLAVAATSSPAPAAGEDAAPAGLPEPSGAVLYLGDSNRFAVVAAPGEEGRRLARVAQMAWPLWRDALDLPDRLPVSITVRLAEGEWRFPEPFWRVAAEPGGVVTVWIQGGGGDDLATERRWLIALAEGALRRQAIRLGASLEARPPGWLAVAAAEEALARSQPALMDAWQQAAGASPGRLPDLRSMLFGGEAHEVGGDEARRMAAHGLWLWLRAEAGRSTAWRQLVAALLTGVSPGLALVNAYPSSFGNATAEDLELAWQTGVAGLAGMRSTPLLEAAESRRWLRHFDRVVAWSRVNEREEALALSEVWSGRTAPFLLAERESRAQRLTTIFPRMHPFYRNAAGSLGRVYLAQREGDRRAWLKALEEWREDFATGEELERASRELLDAAAR